jgi:hypothetical protein
MAKLDGKDDSKGGTSSIRTVDELMQDHVDFLDTCLKECMLTNKMLLRVRHLHNMQCLLLILIVDTLQTNGDLHNVCNIFDLAFQRTGED